MFKTETKSQKVLEGMIIIGMILTVTGFSLVTMSLHGNFPSGWWLALFVTSVVVIFTAKALKTEGQIKLVIAEICFTSIIALSWIIDTVLNPTAYQNFIISDFVAIALIVMGNLTCLLCALKILKLWYYREVLLEISSWASKVAEKAEMWVSNRLTEQEILEQAQGVFGRSPAAALNPQRNMALRNDISLVFHVLDVINLVSEFADVKMTKIVLCFPETELGKLRRKAESLVKMIEQRL